MGARQPRWMSWGPEWQRGARVASRVAVGASSPRFLRECLLTVVPGEVCSARQLCKTEVLELTLQPRSFLRPLLLSGTHHPPSWSMFLHFRKKPVSSSVSPVPPGPRPGSSRWTSSPCRAEWSGQAPLSPPDRLRFLIQFVVVLWEPGEEVAGAWKREGYESIRRRFGTILTEGTLLSCPAAST